MKTKTRQIYHADLKYRFESKGLTLNGVQIFISDRNKYERKEMDQGLLIYHYYQPLAFLHTNARGRKRFICHPDKRGELESEYRRN